MSDAVELPVGDPWIDAYLRFRAAVLNREVTTLAEVEAYALELRHGLPGTAPSVPAAAFITADIAITFPDWSYPRYANLMVDLWQPDFARGPRTERGLVIEGDI